MRDRALPTGTLTFFFSDIQGSTRLADGAVRAAVAAQRGLTASPVVLATNQTKTLPIAIYNFISYASIDWAALWPPRSSITVPVLALRESSSSLRYNVVLPGSAARSRVPPAS